MEFKLNIRENKGRFSARVFWITAISGFCFKDDVTELKTAF